MDLSQPTNKETSFHPSTFKYLKPSDQQIETMAILRSRAADYALALDHYLPGGPDKTYILRRVRETAMWVNVCVTREANGTPRT